MTVQELFHKAQPIKTDVFTTLLARHYNFPEYKTRLNYRRREEGKPEITNDIKIIAEIYDNFEKGYSDILKVKAVPHPETLCVVCPFYWEEDLYTADYDVSCIEKKELLETYHDGKEIHDYKDFLEPGFQPTLMTYCFMYDAREDIMGYEIPEATIRRYPMKDIAAALFWELIWFGYTNEESEKNRIKSQGELDEAIEESEKEEGIDVEEAFGIEEVTDMKEDVSISGKALESILTEEEKTAAIKNHNEAVDYFREVYWGLVNLQKEK